MFALAPHAHLAVVDDDVVFLDVAADRYLCVPGGHSLLKPTPDRAAVAPDPREVVEALQSAGLLSPAVTRREVPALPCRDLPSEATPALTWREALRLLAAVWDALIHYRGRPLSAILAFASAQRRPPGAGDAAEVVRLAQLYRDAVVWLPLPRKCLIRSFVLLRFLQRSGLGARWVFGVRTWPFSAHCWLQVDDLVLDDFAERLVRYEPILAVA